MISEQEMGMQLKPVYACEDGNSEGNRPKPPEAKITSTAVHNDVQCFLREALFL